MKRDIFYTVILLIGIFLYCFLTRYEIVVSGAYSGESFSPLRRGTGAVFGVYKIDRMTGKTWSWGINGKWYLLEDKK